MTIVEKDLYEDMKQNKLYELVELQVYGVDYTIQGGYEWKAKLIANSAEEAIQTIYDNARQKRQTIKINTIGKVCDLHMVPWDLIKYLCLKYNDKVMNEIENEELEKSEAVKKSGLYKQNRGQIEKNKKSWRLF